jgi:hypothetical protein
MQKEHVRRKRRYMYERDKRKEGAKEFFPEKLILRTS